MKKEYDFARAKRVTFRGLPRERERARHTKVRITILLDQDVLAFFRGKASQPGAEPYQTQINRVLREHMSGGGPPGTAALLTDERFLSRLAERVAEYTVTRTAGRGRPARRKDRSGGAGARRSGHRVVTRSPGRRGAGATGGPSDRGPLPSGG